MDKHKRKKQKKYYGFTLVELIIVITILAILATISFVSFSGYTKKGNDTKKLSNLQTIEKGLDLLSIETGKYPNPDKQYGTGILDGVNLNYVGYVGEDLARLIKLDKAPIDNVTDTNYVYGVSSDFKKFQIATTFEDYEANILIPKVYAGNLKTKVTGNYKYPLKIGDKLYSLPSLIFVGNIITNTGFIVDGGENNLYDKVNNKQTTTKILEKITGSGGLVLTGVTIPKITTKEFSELKDLPNDFAKLGIKDKEYLGEIIYGDRYLVEKTTIGGKTLPEVPKLTCPEGYILVPGDKTNTFKYSDGTPTNDFCVAKYEMGYLDNILPNTTVGGNTWNTVKYDINKNPISRAGIYPITEITQQQAIDSCKKIGEGFYLITNNEWMTIARNIENISLNWSTNKVGEGFIYNGVSGNTLLGCNSKGGNTESRLYATKTGPGNEECNFKRKHILSNGSEIWDFAGNVREHVNKGNNIDGKNYFNGTTNIPGCNNNTGWIELSYCLNKEYGPFLNLSSLNGIGKIYYSLTVTDNIFLRGGSSYNSNNAGIYSLSLDWNSESFNHLTGFRCSYKK